VVECVEDGGGAGALVAAHVAVHGHAGLGVAELVGCGASGQAGLVHEGGDGAAEDVGGDPAVAAAGEGVAEVGLGVVGVAEPALGGGEDGCLRVLVLVVVAAAEQVDAPGGSCRVRVVSLPESASWRTSPRPLTRTMLAVTWTVLASRSTHAQRPAEASEIRRPVASMKATRSGRSRRMAVSS